MGTEHHPDTDRQSIELRDSVLGDYRKIDDYMRQSLYNPTTPPPSPKMRRRWQRLSWRLQLLQRIRLVWQRYNILVGIPTLAAIFTLVVLWMAFYVRGENQAATVITLLVIAAFVDLFAVILLCKFDNIRWSQAEHTVINFVRSTVTRRPERKVLGLLISNLTLIVVILFGAFSFLKFPTTYGKTSILSSVLSSAVASISLKPDASQVLSRGEIAFDLARTNSEAKTEAAKLHSAHDYQEAAQYWDRAIFLDPSDAEALIYRENINVLNSKKPFVSLVVGTVLEAEFMGGGRDILQGAYMMQKNWNHVWHKDDVQIFLIVANAGIKSEQATLVAQHIVDEASKDKTIIGAMGWPTSSSAKAAVAKLAAAHIPIISPTASSTQLSNISPYFFRVAPTDTEQGNAGALYAFHHLKAQRVIVLYDDTDAYSNSLQKSFTDEFSKLTSANNTSVTKLKYKRDDVKSLQTLVKDISNTDIDLIYFAGYVNDASILLKSLPNCTPQKCLNVLGGDALFVQGNYSLEALTRYNRLRFTSFAYPTEDSNFVQSYAHIFDPEQKYLPNTYGHNYPDADAILAYKAMLAITTSLESLITNDVSISSYTMRQALSHVNVTSTIFGEKETFSFDTQGNVTHSSIVILEGQERGKTVPLFKYIQGKLVPYAKV